MVRAFLIKYAEIGIKGKNRYVFENALVRRVRERLDRCVGEFMVEKEQGRVYVEVLSDDFDKEEEEGKVSVRSRFAGDEGQKDLSVFINDICEEIRTKTIRKEEVQEEK